MVIMLTVEKVKVYQRFGGNIDGYARSSGKDSAEITVEDWRQIGELEQAIYLVASGRAAPEFAAELERKLGSACAEAATCQALRRWRSDWPRISEIIGLTKS